ncbi:hypothetical protein [Nannocystis punicea]|uniref:Uncharacterized protein n=1 Tax=Nannocystis punicea TaxID=2995304 RepID=A0ABY7H3F8_9BACT|nr:hypothetical protein [Nannocystis poenicansa]WAS93693.1 hypothetical protein O0S08_46770 [Nannocystis poenicansa]
MSRNILMLAPALAFALPFVTSQPTMARPLASQAPETQWDARDGDDDDDDDDDHDDDDKFIALKVCFKAQLVLAEDQFRSYSCDMVEGPQCLSNCTAEAVAPLCQTEIANRARGGDFASCQEERLAACRSQCESGGAAFCRPDDELKARGKDDHDDHDDDKKDHDDDKDDNIDADVDIHEEDGLIFIDVQVCLDLKVDEDDI